MDRRLVAGGVVVVAMLGLFAAVAYFGFVAGDPAGEGFETVWEHDPGPAEGPSAPVAVAVDGGTAVAAAVGDATGDDCALAGVDAGGEERWRTETPCPAADPGAGTLDGPTVLLPGGGSDGSGLRGYDAADGRERLASDADAAAPPAVGDATGDGDPEVLVAGDGLSVLDRDGEVVWTAPLPGAPAAAPAVGDVAGDGDPEVVVAVRVGDGGRLLAFDDGGERLWESRIDGPIDGLALADTRRGAVAVTAAAGEVHAIEGTDGSTRWEALLQDGPVRVGNVEGNRVFVGGAGAVWALELLEGDVVWRQSIAGDDPITRPAVGDATGDGEAEVLAVATDGTIAALDATDGSVRARGVRDTVVTVAPIAVDLDGDGRTELVVRDAEGRLFAVRTVDAAG